MGDGTGYCFIYFIVVRNVCKIRRHAIFSTEPIDMSVVTCIAVGFTIKVSLDQSLVDSLIYFLNAFYYQINLKTYFIIFYI